VPLYSYWLNSIPSEVPLMKFVIVTVTIESYELAENWF